MFDFDEFVEKLGEIEIELSEWQRQYLFAWFAARPDSGLQPNRDPNERFVWGHGDGPADDPYGHAANRRRMERAQARGRTY